MAPDQDQRLSDVVAREQSRLRRFISRRVSDRRDAEDILQDVFVALVEANRLLVPIDHVTGWLFRVARNRITDVFRRRRAVPLDDVVLRSGDVDGDVWLRIEELLPSTDAGPDAVFARQVLVDALAEALEELPDDQREVFVAHEIDGLSFKEMAEAWDVNLNTLLSRKRYAVQHLRSRLRRVYDAASHS
jgi:RNA polymerase sigma factor (sigma-70 family)